MGSLLGGWRTKHSCCSPPRPQPWFQLLSSCSLPVLLQSLLPWTMASTMATSRWMASLKCAKKTSLWTASSRIVGGKEVNPKYRLPYQAFVYPSVPGVGSFMCGGTIVNKRYVITAAHCTDYQGSTITDVKVAIGEHSICDGVTNEGDSWISAKRVVNHPNYGNHDNDIAVLELSEDITFTANIEPACLPTTPGIYARVQGFLPWIKSLIADGECGTGGSTGGTTGAVESGSIQSDNYPKDYPVDQDKTYEISVAAGKTIKMAFAAFSLEAHNRCGWDYLKIEDGNGSTLLDKSCGSVKPATITSKTNKVKVIFHSDYSVTSNGFKIDWVSV